MIWAGVLQQPNLLALLQGAAFRLLGQGISHPTEPVFL